MSHVVQLPLPLARAMHCGAETELVEEARDGANTRYYLHVFDDFERAEKLKRMEGSSDTDPSRIAAERGYCSRLEAARRKIQSDEFIGRLLPTLDVDCWPPPKHLEELVMLRAELLPTAKDTTELQNAFNLHRQAIETAGLHSIERTTGATKQQQADGNSNAGAAQVVHYQRYKSTEESEVLTLQKKVESDCLAAEFGVTLYDIPSLTAKLPMVVQAKAGAAFGMQWGQLYAKHRASLVEGQPLLISVEDLVTLLPMSQSRAVQLLGSASSEGKKVRIKTGAFVTRLEFKKLHVVLRAGKLTPFGVAEKETIGTALGAKFVEATSRGTSMEVACSAKKFPAELANDATKLKGMVQQSISPLGSVTSVLKAAYINEMTIACTVELANNYYFVCHGPRMKAQLPAFEAEATYLREQVDRNLDTQFVSDAYGNASRSQVQQQQVGSAAQSNDVTSSLAGNVAATPDQIQQRIINALTSNGGALTKKEVLAVPELQGLPKRAIEKELGNVATYDKKAGWTLKM